MERTVHLEDMREIQMLFGKYDTNLRLIEKEFKVKIIRQNNGLKVNGQRPQVDKTCELFDYLRGLIDTGSEIKERDIIYAIK